MSGEMDPAKLNQLKVVELRAELSARGLDTKGNKPVLVERLREALEQEGKKGSADTSIGDTSTKDKGSESADKKDQDDAGDDQEDEEDLDEAEEGDEDAEECDEDKLLAEDMDEQDNKNEENKPKEEKIQNGDHEEKKEDKEKEKDKDTPNKNKSKSSDAKKDGEKRGEKRRHEGDKSPERVTRKRSRSPIREDEPEVNLENVQLSWVDSDLHLAISKDTFCAGQLHGHPHFGYLHGGARATHGVNDGKVFYEIKYVDNVKWEEPIRGKDRRRDERRKNENQKRKEQEAKKKAESDKKSETDKKSESDKKSETDKKSESEKKTDDKKKEPEKKDEEKKDEPEKKDESTTEVKIEVKTEEKTEETQPEEPKPAEEKMETDQPEEKTDEKEVKEEPKTEETKEKTEEKPTEEPEKQGPIHSLRVGWSTLKANLQLGEDNQSYGVDSDGYKVLNSTFHDIESKFTSGDVIGCFLDLTSDPVQIKYTINGVLQDFNIEIPREELPEETAMFPHVLTRNVKFEINFGKAENPMFAASEELSDFVMIQNVENKIDGLRRPEKRDDCKVIMMIGLPCSGKTYWVNKHLEENPDKRFNVLGTTQILDKMKYRGKLRKNQKESFHFDMAAKCMTKLIDLACQRRRNYILDQTNLFSSAQRRKMRQFEGFQREAVVIVVPDETQSDREKQRHQADGKDIPDSAILEMKANFSIPTECEWLNVVLFPELEEKEAKEAVEKYNKQGRDAGYGPNFNKNKDGFRKKNWRNNRFRDNRRWGNRGRRDRDRFGPRSGGGGGGGGGNWNRSERNNRGGDRWSRSGDRGARMVPRDNGYSRDSRRDRDYGRDRKSHDRSGSQRKGGRDSGNWKAGRQSGSWGSQSGWGGQSAWAPGAWGGGSGQQWKSYNQGYGQSYGGQYGNQQYGNWNYYGQYGQGWGNSN